MHEKLRNKLKMYMFCDLNFAKLLLICFHVWLYAQCIITKITMYIVRYKCYNKVLIEIKDKISEIPSKNRMRKNLRIELKWQPRWRPPWTSDVSSEMGLLNFCEFIHYKRTKFLKFWSKKPIFHPKS